MYVHILIVILIKFVRFSGNLSSSTTCLTQVFDKRRRDKCSGSSGESLVWHYLSNAGFIQKWQITLQIILANYPSAGFLQKLTHDGDPWHDEKKTKQRRPYQTSSATQGASSCATTASAAGEGATWARPASVVELSSTIPFGGDAKGCSNNLLKL